MAGNIDWKFGILAEIKIRSACDVGRTKLEVPPIILIAKKTSNRESFVRSLDSVGMAYEIVETLAKFNDAFEKTNAQVVVHVLEEFERGEVGVFHHRLVRTERGRSLARFLIYRGTNERAISFGVDLGMLRAIQAEQALSALGYTLQLALKAHADLEPDLREALELTASGDCCMAKDTLELQKAISKKYPLVENLAIVAAYSLLILNGDAEGAARKGQSILSRSPTNVRAMTLVGEALLHLGEYESAAKMLMNAESFAAGNPSRLALIGRIAAHTGNLDAAKRCLFKSVEICPVIRTVKPLVALVTLSVEEKKILTDLLALRLSKDALSNVLDCL